MALHMIGTPHNTRFTDFHDIVVIIFILLWCENGQHAGTLYAYLRAIIYVVPHAQPQIS